MTYPRLGSLVASAYGSPYQGIRGTIYSAAREAGIDPYLALATVENEGGFYDDPNEYYRHVGDQGQSYGPYQEHIRGRGARNPRDIDPVRQTQRFAADIRKLLESGFQGSPGQLIAAAQRPYDPIGAARKYQSSYDRYSSEGPTSEYAYSPVDSGQMQPYPSTGYAPLPRLRSRLGITPASLSLLNMPRSTPQFSFGGVLGSLGRGLGSFGSTLFSRYRSGGLRIR